MDALTANLGIEKMPLFKQGGKFMAVMGALLLLIALIGLLLGLIKPSIVIWWGSNKTRGKVLLTYGLVLIASIVFAAIGAPSDLEAGKTALTEKNYKDAVTRLEAVESSDPGYSEAQRLLPEAKKSLLLSKLEAAEAASSAGDHAKVVGLLSDYPSDAAGSMDAAKILEQSKDALADAERERLAHEEQQAVQKQAEKAQRELAIYESAADPTDTANPQDKDKERRKGRVRSLVDKFKAMAVDAEWQFTRRESPIDGPVYETIKTFESDRYAAEMYIQLRCVQAKKSFSVTFESHVYDSDGNHMLSSAFRRNMDNFQPFAQGRVKWANKQPEIFIAGLRDHNNVATLGTHTITDAAGASGSGSPSTAFASLLPAYFELSNGAGEFILNVPSGNSSINKVLAACE